jgi:hypothetical protein
MAMICLLLTFKYGDLSNYFHSEGGVFNNRYGVERLGESWCAMMSHVVHWFNDVVGRRL